MARVARAPPLRRWRTRCCHHNERRGCHAATLESVDLLAALLVTTLSFASFASAHTDDVKVLHLRGVQVESQLVDVAPEGPEPSLGDSFVLSENLLRDGHKVGISGVVCTFVRLQHPPSAVECVITARLGSDQLTVQGLSFDQPRNVFAITGGTGRWRNAGGQVVVRDVSETESDITLFISDLG